MTWKWVHFWKPSRKGPGSIFEPWFVHRGSTVDSYGPPWIHVGPRWTHHGSTMNQQYMGPPWIHVGPRSTILSSCLDLLAAGCLFRFLMCHSNNQGGFIYFRIWQVECHSFIREIRTCRGRFHFGFMFFQSFPFVDKGKPDVGIWKIKVSGSTI